MAWDFFGAGFFGFESPLSVAVAFFPLFAFESCLAALAAGVFAGLAALFSGAVAALVLRDSLDDEPSDELPQAASNTAAAHMATDI